MCVCVCVSQYVYIYAMQVNSSWAAGRFNEARSQANIAKTLNIVGIVVGIIFWFFVAIGIISRIATAATYATQQ